MNPEAVLNRGYAIVQKSDGHAVKSPQELLNQERVLLRLAEGVTEAVIDHPQGHSPNCPSDSRQPNHGLTEIGFCEHTNQTTV
jgi:exodeoxyribonuclease VII large subunit